MRNVNLKLLIIFLVMFIFGLGVNNIYPLQGREELSADKEQNKIISPRNGFAESKKVEYAPDEIIVKLKEGKNLDDIKELNEEYNVISSEKIFKEATKAEDVLKQLKEKLSKLGTEHDNWYWQLDKNSKEYKEHAAKLQKEKEEVQGQIAAQEELISRLEQRQKRAPEGAVTADLGNIYVLKAKENTSIPVMVGAYNANPNVEYAQPNYKNETYMVLNDPYFFSTNSWGQGYDDLWGLKKTNAPWAWDMSQGSGVVVAVIDTGLDYNHEDIFSNAWTNLNEIANNGIDDDGNGYIDDRRGIDLSGDTNGTIIKDLNPIDFIGHGTHVSGIIAAIGNNGKGIIGVAPKAKIMPVKIFPNAYDSVCAAAIKYAADSGADILNNSWGPSGSHVSNPVIEDAIRYAYAKGCVIIFAAGNYSADTAYFAPANSPMVIAVASTDRFDKKSDFSNYGVTIDVGAPGGDSENNSLNKAFQNILSLRAGGTDLYGDGISIVNTKYYRARGTSMACPYVSGLAALVLAKYPAFSNEDIRQVLRVSAYDAETPGFDIYTGAGRINATKALAINSVLRAKITSPVNGSSLDQVAKLVAVSGTAMGTNFKQFELFFAPKNNLGNWAPIGSAPIQFPVGNGVLRVWSIRNLTTASYVLKLVATDYSGLQFQNYAEVNVEHSAKRITTNSNTQYMPAVSNNRIVWWDFRNGENNWDIYLYDLSTNAERRITVNSANQGRPRISGNCIVYSDKRNGNWDIYLYDLTTNTERQITSNPADQLSPAISGNRIVWEDYRNGNSDIYMYDLSTNKEKRITVNTFDENYPEISGDRIVWVDYRNGNSDIYLYDLAANAERRITTDPSMHGFPAISGNRIVWTDDRNGNLDIYLYDLTTNTERQVTTDIQGQIYPHISGDRIVWEDGRNGNFDIYLYDLAANKEQQLTSNLDWQRNPDISGDNIVWEDYRNGNAEIYFLGVYPTSPKVTDAGTYTSSSSVLSASWTLSSDPYSAIAGYEYKITRDSITGPIIKNWTYTTNGVASGTTPAVTVGGLALVQGKTYYFSVRAKNGVGLYSIPGYSNGIKIDITPPTTPVVTDGGTYTSSATTLTARWTSSDPESGIKSYSYKITQDSVIGTVVKNWTSTGTTPSVTATGLTLQQGKQYYFTVIAENPLKQLSVQGYSNGIKVDTTAPSAPTVADEGVSTISTTSLKVLWVLSSDAESGIANYEYKITQDSISGAIIKNWTVTTNGVVSGTSPAVTVTGLTLGHGKNYYFSMRAKNGAGIYSAVKYSNGILVK